MQKTVNLTHQKGISFVGLIFWGAFFGLLGVVIAQVVPTYLEFQAVEKAVAKAKEGQTVTEVRKAFDKYSEIDNIKSITGNDLEVSKGAGDKTVISFKYNREVHLFGPVSLLIKYSGESK
jgi:Domain of unknown function (DUF4845)